MVLVFRALYDTRWARPRGPQASATFPPLCPTGRPQRAMDGPGGAEPEVTLLRLRPQSDGSHPGCLGPVEGGEARLAVRWNIEREEERIGIVG